MALNDTLQSVKWGRVITGALLITAAVAACIFIPGLAPIAEGVGQVTGAMLGHLGTAATSIGSWLSTAVTQIAAAGAQHAGTTMVTSAVVGGTAIAVASNYAEKVQESLARAGVSLQNPRR